MNNTNSLILKVVLPLPVMLYTLLNEDNSANKNMINLPHPVPDPCTG